MGKLIDKIVSDKCEFMDGIYDSFMFPMHPRGAIHIEAAWRHYTTLCEMETDGWKCLEKPPKTTSGICKKCLKKAEKIIELKTNSELADLVAALVNLKDRAGRLGLWETMHALEIPIRKVGWEIAKRGDPEQAKIQRRYEKAQR